MPDYNTDQLNPIIQQAKDEYEHALDYRQKRQKDWLTIDDLYYGKKKKSLVSRANVHVPKMQGTIESFVAKIDDSPYMRYEAMEEGDKPKAEKANALLARDRNVGDWELLDILAKKQAALYGRAIFKKYSTSENGFTDYLEIVDVLDFLIDPLAGGARPIENARYLGQDNIIRTLVDIKKSPDIYDITAAEDIAAKLTSDTEADDKYASRRKRRDALNLSDAVYVSDDALRLVEWYTIYDGEWYYCLFDPKSTKGIRVVPLKEVFPTEERPFATWAVFPRSDEFWTPGVGELEKEVNIVQNVSISQMLDNNAYRNYGMMVYDASKVDDPKKLEPRPMGKVPVNGNPKDIIQNIQFPVIDQAVALYNLMENIFDKEVMPAQAKGMPHSKRMSATEFAGLIDQVADKFFAANRTYRHCLRRIAKLYLQGVEQNLTKAKRVRILGAEGVEWREVKAKDVKGEFDVVISSGATDEQAENLFRDRFGEYVVRNRTNPRINQRFLDEKEAQVFGFEQHEVDRLLNPEMEGDWEILSEAASENEMMLNKDVEPNKSATSGHVEKHLDYVRSHHNLSDKVIKRILTHAKAEVGYAKKNEELKASRLIRDKVGVQAQAIDGAAMAATKRRMATPETQVNPPIQEEVRQAAIAQAPQP